MSAAVSTDRRPPMVGKIARRIRVKIDGTGDATVRGVSPQGRKTFYGARRGSVVAWALRYTALGYTDVQISFRLARDPGWRDFPATQQEALEACRQLGEQRTPGSGQFRRTVERWEREFCEESGVPRGRCVGCMEAGRG